MLRRLLPTLLLALAPTFALAPHAHAANLCAWIVESDDTDDLGTSRKLTLWLQSDTDMDFFIQMAGDGIVNGMGKSNSPMSATYTLHAGQADSPWSYGATLDPPAKIDETIEIHKMPADIFSDAPKPLLTKFVFKRTVPESEKKPSTIFAKHQCAVVKP